MSEPHASSAAAISALLSRLAFTAPVTPADLGELHARLRAEHVPAGITIDVVLRDTPKAIPSWCTEAAIVEVVVGGGGPAPWRGWVKVQP